MRIQYSIALLLCLNISGAQAADPELGAAIDSNSRTAGYRERDMARHPLETLTFFGIKPDMTVVELWPGGGWYTEILAPYLKREGKFYAAHFNPESELEYFRLSRQRFTEKLAADPKQYAEVITTIFDPPNDSAIAQAGSVDLVLTFRNVHNWYMRGGGEDNLLAAFTSVFAVLKSGGVLGVVDHRMPADRPLSDQDASGYMREDFVIKVAQNAGFKLVARSEINANPRDDANHPKGVWTLPPSLRLGEQDADRYLTIGESDRMTLKFVKP